MSEERNPLCTKTSCLDWHYKHKDNPLFANTLCERCGFSKKENAFRKSIPLTICDDGLRRKIIPAKKAGESIG